MEFSSNLSAIYTKWCAQTFPPIFRLFAIFDLNFAKIVAPPSNENEKCVVLLKEWSILKNRWKLHKNRRINCHTILVWTMPPRSGRPSVTYKKKTPIFAPTAGERNAISPQTLHAERECCDNSKWCQSFFDPTHSFSCRGENADCWSLTHWVNLIPAGCHGNLPVTSKNLYSLTQVKS